ncbi:McrB family protein [Helicobacter pylori]|uniref:5-methylcytosine-specific restriction enzyme B n=1 Tax=Helicobacter pylori (strain 51) TaxID=290847 RepID=A0AAI8EZZ1_HELP1|nr:McrB family protein [Helicobacter pylori]ACX97392.1 5-methylcytosine-specific restriction enzyme B [Helicobacter pylori 51]WRB51819.1 McrB family protein [Helicobacter pylori]
MKVYLRKVDNQCINNKRISITKGILKHFFDNANNQDEVDMKGILSDYNDKVSILLATDPRFGGGIYRIIRAEEDKIKENRSDYKLKVDDILLFTYISPKKYTLEIILPTDTRYNVLNGLISNRHLLVFSENETSSLSDNKIDESVRIDGGKNIILYGVPGSGKSYTLQRDYCNDNSVVEKIVFHPDYSYSDFVGQIMPSVDDSGIVSYKFNPGPFTNILKKAYHNPQIKHVLVIDEINRGNAPAIFGEIFQLLDRLKHDKNGFKKGSSEYAINNMDIANIVHNDKNASIRIPSNLWIIATMNTSDQNVFALDTAFQRRFSMQLIENSFENVDDDFKNMKILDTDITWQKFCTTINEKIAQNNEGLSSMEDKRFGVYFVNIDDLKSKENFAHKVIKYLWDDVFKFDRNIIFDTTKFNTLEAVVKNFTKEKGRTQFDIFSDDVKELLFNA